MHSSPTKRVLPLLASLLALVPGLGAGRLEAAAAGTVEILVHPSCPNAVIAKDLLVAAGSSAGGLTGIVGPQLGTLSDLGDHYLYEPSSHFWTLGTDSVTFTLAGSGGIEGVAETGTVLLEAALFASSGLSEGFESGGWGSSWVALDPDHVLAANASGGLSGGWLLNMASPPSGDAYLTSDVDDIRGGGGNGSGGAGTIRVPPTYLGAEPLLATTVMTLGDPLAPQVALKLRRQTDGWEIGLDGGGPVSWLALPAGSTHREMQARIGWWRAVDRPGCTAGAALWLDGSLRQLVPVSAGPIAQLAELRVGRMNEVVTIDQALELDDVRLELLDGEAAAREPVLLDGFESGAPSGGWTTVPITANTSSTAALAGEQGLEFGFDSATGLAGGLLHHSLATPTGRLGVRFRVDRGTVSIASSDVVRLFSAHDAGGTRLASLALRPEGTEIRLEVKVLEQGGGVQTLVVPLGSDPEAWLALDWRAAAGVDSAATGVLRVWSGAELIAELGGLDNGGQSAVQLRFGAKALNALANGTVRVDQFESWR